MNDSEQDMKYCPICGTKLDRKAQFCFACGSPLEEEVTIKPEQEKVSAPVTTGYPASRVEQKMDQISVKLAEKKEKIMIKLAEKREQIEVKRAHKKELVAMKKEKKKAKKSYRKGLIAGIIISCIVFGVVGFFVVGLFTFGTYQETYTYYYNPASPSSIEECTIYADTASINIQYNTTPVSYYARADVAFDISGLFVSGKTYKNFYKPIIWENETSATLRLKINHWSWIDPTNWFKVESNKINLTLRTDIVYDIKATSITGGISMTIPENVTVNDLSLSCTTGSVKVYGIDTNFTQGLSSSTTTGSVLLNFTRCTFGDNIAGSSTTGGVTLKTYNAEYTEDITWTLSTTTGSVSMNIQQYSNMSASVTGSASTTTGGVKAYYYDNSGDYGAKFTGSTTTGSYDYAGPSEGFSPVGSVCSTNDFGSAIYTYDLTLSTTTGSITVDGYNN